MVIVNQTLANRYWPHEDPIGKRVKGFDPRGQHDDWLTVVGVVDDTRSGGIERRPFSQIYEPEEQRGSEQIGSLVIRTSGNPAALSSTVRGLIRKVDRNITISAITPMESLLAQQTMERRFQTWIIGVFSAAALLLAALGVFALMHYSVTARTNQIGIRMAVGANAADIARLVLRNSIALAVAGILAGGLAALWSAKFISGMLYQVTWYDPVSLIRPGLLLLTVAVLGSSIPGYQASHIDPMIALRQE